MSTRVGKVKVKTTSDGRTRIERTPVRRSVSANIGAEKKARRQVDKWVSLAKGRARRGKASP